MPGEWPVFEALFAGVHVRAILTGMGQDHALEAAKKFLADKPDLCISTGLAGSLRSEHCPGDILAARLISEVGEPVAVASHTELLAMAVDCGARQIECLATSKTIVARAEQKRQLANQAEAVEMESFAILAEAARYGVPAVAIRAVSDTLDFDMPYEFERARDAQGQIRVMGVLSQVLRKPAGLPDLLRLTRDCRFASKCLAIFLDDYVGAMGARLIPIEQDTVSVL